MYGKYPVIDDVPYSYDQRSLPYVEDPTKYHQYEIIGDFRKLETYIKNCSNLDLKKSIDQLVLRYYVGYYSKLTAYKGRIADGFGSTGGGIQIELPLPVDWLEKLGLLREIK